MGLSLRGRQSNVDYIAVVLALKYLVCWTLASWPYVEHLSMIFASNCRQPATVSLTNLEPITCIKVFPWTLIIFPKHFSPHRSLSILHEKNSFADIKPPTNSLQCPRRHGCKVYYEEERLETLGLLSDFQRLNYKESHYGELEYHSQYHCAHL